MSPALSNDSTQALARIYAIQGLAQETVNAMLQPPLAWPARENADANNAMPCPGLAGVADSYTPRA
eukprot:scaffold47261_cov34-Prasinocladus_malaysianus.AAC.1